MDKPIFVLGFDGLSPLCFVDQECFHHVGEHQGILPSVPGNLSGPAWHSLFSGVCPGESGLLKHDPETRMISSKVPPLWERYDATFAIYNVPTLRPIPLHPNIKEFVGGLFFRDKDKFTFPHDLQESLLENGYSVDMDRPTKQIYMDIGVDCGSCECTYCFGCEHHDPAVFPKDLQRFEAKTREPWFIDAAFDCADKRALLNPPPVDVVVLVITMPDRLFHRHFHLNTEKTRGIIRRVHDKVKKIAEYWLDGRGFAETHNWMIISDHGFKDNGRHCKNGIWASNTFNLLGAHIWNALEWSLIQAKCPRIGDDDQIKTVEDITESDDEAIKKQLAEVGYV